MNKGLITFKTLNFFLIYYVISLLKFEPIQLGLFFSKENENTYRK